MKSRRMVLALVAAALLAGARPDTASAQEVDLVKGALGGAAGVAAGAYVTLASVVAQARAGHYILGIDDFLGWRSAPVLIGGGTGLAVGLWKPEQLSDGVMWGAIGTAAGTGVGLVVGPMIWDDPGARWAGGAIGAGVGLVAGAFYGALKQDKDVAAGSANAVAVPVVVRLRF